MLDPTVGPTEAVKKEGILCKSSWEVNCSLVGRLQDISVKGWPLCRDLVPLQWRLSQSRCPFSPSSFMSELLASKDVGLAGCLAAKCPWSSLHHGTAGWFGLEVTSGGLYPTAGSTQGQLWVQTSLLRGAFGIFYICLHYPGIAALLYCPLINWALQFLGWPGPKLAEHQTQQLPAFQTAEDAEVVLPK